MKFQVIIIDDSEQDYNRIKAILESIPTVTVVGKHLGNHPYDKVRGLLPFHSHNILIIDHDLQHDEKTGLDLYNEIADAGKFVIFFSQFPEARDNDRRFLNAKFLQKHPEEVHLRERLVEILEVAANYLEMFQEAHKLEFYEGATKHFVSWNDILYLQGQRKKTDLYSRTLSKPISITGTVGDVFKKYELEKMGFIQVNKSEIVNSYNVISVKPSRLGSKKVIHLRNNEKPIKISIGKTYLKELPLQYLISRFKED